MNGIEKQYVIDALAEDSWRMFRILGEFVQGFEELADIGKAVTIFGSARLKEDSDTYKKTSELAAQLAKQGYTIVTGGGPGIMEAANRGAYDAGARSIGLNITLPHEQVPNAYITPELAFRFHYFALRKMHFLIHARGLVAFPGGYGTLDELFEVLTLIQTHKMDPIPVVLVGRAFWRRAIDFDYLIDEGSIAPGDINLFEYADDAEEILAALERFHSASTDKTAPA